MLFGVLYVASITFFALIYYSLGAECFAFSSDSAEWDFRRVLWLSVHTFSTIGYGTSVPDCTAAEVLVLLESYVALLLTFWFSGFTIFFAMRPRSRVRFSKNYLLSTENDELLLQVRMVRESPHALRDARATVQAVLIEDEQADGSAMERCVELKLVASTKSYLDQWTLCHHIVAGSPLWEIRTQLASKLTGIDVSLCVYDTAYMQEMRLYASYASNEFVQRAHFAPMIKLVTNPRGGAATLFVDHAKLDAFIREGISSPARKRGFAGAIRRSVTQSNFGTALRHVGSNSPKPSHRPSSNNWDTNSSSHSMPHSHGLAAMRSRVRARRSSHE